jgi:hypothetical protein
MVREYRATLAVRAPSLAGRARCLSPPCQRGRSFGLFLGLPKPWDEHESRDRDPEIDTTFRCVDCGKCTLSSDEYYTVDNALWGETAGMAPDGGMLCLACLERRIGRPLTFADFTALPPTQKVWRRHLAARSAPPDPEPVQLDLPV